MYFWMINDKEFVSDVITSLTLYALIPRFGTMLTKNSVKTLASPFSSVIIVDFSIRQIMLHALTLFQNNDFVVFENFFVSVR